ncbi:hypothetical protein [Methanoregula sp.]|uniref:hypothetical protein n=1 Tax=Methanoregula sp. TaxID=2052170 RepID=UPI002CABFE15|nr:hypothetical protein [Methanoregula sp.]HVP95532.1 hypothetical protein [Methanoregula sp.]
MNLRLFLVPVLLLVLGLCVAGCTQPDTTPAVPATPTVIPVTAVTAAAATLPPDSATPEPTGVLPSYWSVNVQAYSNGMAINPEIIIAFRGGQGMNLVPQIKLKVTRSDGVVETGEMDEPFSMGQSVTFAATTGYQDRAEAWAITPQGDAVKILDQYVPFRSYNTG